MRARFRAVRKEFHRVPSCLFSIFNGGHPAVILAPSFYLGGVYIAVSRINLIIKGAGGHREGI